MFVGNLNFKTTKDDLIEILAPVGQPVDVFLPLDRDTGKPRGFAFIEFESQEELEKAIALLNGREVGGRMLKANPAEARPPRVGGPRPGPGGPRPSSGPRPGGFEARGGRSGGFAPAPDMLDPFDERMSRSKGSRRNLRARKRSL